MFTELTIYHPKLGVTNSTEARAFASTRLKSIPGVVFNHEENAGKPLQTPSPYSVHENNGAVVIDAVGRLAVELLLSAAGAIQGEFLTIYPDGEVNLRSGNVDVTLSPRPVSYAVDLVIQNSSQRKFLRRDELAGATLPLAEIAERLFREAIEVRAELAGVEIPPEGDFGDFVATPIKPGYAGKQAQYRVFLTFRTNLQFTGPWFIGRLANKGYGRLRAIRTPRPQAQATLPVPQEAVLA